MFLGEGTNRVLQITDRMKSSGRSSIWWKMYPLIGAMYFTIPCLWRFLTSQPTSKTIDKPSSRALWRCPRLRDNLPAYIKRMEIERCRHHEKLEMQDASDLSNTGVNGICLRPYGPRLGSWSSVVVIHKAVIKALSNTSISRYLMMVQVMEIRWGPVTKINVPRQSAWWNAGLCSESFSMALPWLTIDSSESIRNSVLSSMSYCHRFSTADKTLFQDIRGLGTPWPRHYHDIRTKWVTKELPLGKHSANLNTLLTIPIGERSIRDPHRNIIPTLS